jgi:hypothetical protein
LNNDHDQYHHYTQSQRTLPTQRLIRDAFQAFCEFQPGSTGLICASTQPIVSSASTNSKAPQSGDKEHPKAADPNGLM